MLPMTSPTEKPMRVLVANRGEIAVRIVQACRKLGVGAVVVVSDADRDTLAARLADRAVCIGPAKASESYLNGRALIAAAQGTGCTHIHPGYGFLSERAAFRRLVDEAGLGFIGPSAEAIETMGSKTAARKTAVRERVPVVPGSDHVRDAAEAKAVAQELGYPVMLKASAGGGGRGMRIVRSESEIEAAFSGAAREAESAFGDPALYMESYVERGRHIEIQVMGDLHGRVVHLYERDCSTQRRHQKLIEEAPSPVLDAATREHMAAAAVKLAKGVNYAGAGTVEFIYDLDRKAYYFLEMNTRIQVEHPVTEMVTGVDLVAEQIRVASGAPLSFAQADVRLSGHSIQCRINAEAAERHFIPSPGEIKSWRPPSGDGIRLDTHCFEGYVVPPYYDSLMGKLIVHGSDRTAAIARLRTALSAFRVEGVKTTIPFHIAVLGDAYFV